MVSLSPKSTLLSLSHLSARQEHARFIRSFSSTPCSRFPSLLKSTKLVFLPASTPCRCARHPPGAPPRLPDSQEPRKVFTLKRAEPSKGPVRSSLRWANAPAGVPIEPTEPIEEFIPEYTETKKGPVHSSSAALHQRQGASRRPNRLGGCRLRPSPGQGTTRSRCCNL